MGVLGGTWRSSEVLGGTWGSLEVPGGLGGTWGSLEVVGGVNLDHPLLTLAVKNAELYSAKNPFGSNMVQKVQ